MSRKYYWKLKNEKSIACYFKQSERQGNKVGRGVGIVLSGVRLGESQTCVGQRTIASHDAPYTARWLLKLHAHSWEGWQDSIPTPPASLYIKPVMWCKFPYMYKDNWHPSKPDLLHEQSNKTGWKCSYGSWREGEARTAVCEDKEWTAHPFSVSSEQCVSSHLLVCRGSPCLATGVPRSKATCPFLMVTLL